MENDNAFLQKTGFTASALVFLPPFFIGMAFGFGKIVRDCSLTCNVGYQFFPLAIIVIGILSFPLSAVSVRYSSQLGYRRWQIASLLVISSILFLFWVSASISVTNYFPSSNTGSSLSPWGVAVKLTYILFYVWVGVIGTVIAPNIKGTIYKAFSFRNRAKALAMAGAMVISGGLLGSFFAGRLAPFLMQTYGLRYENARDSLILAMGIIPLLIIPAIIIIDRKFPGEPYSGKVGSQETEDEQGNTFSAKVTFRTAFRQIVQDKRLRRMSSLIMTTGMAETVLFYLFYWLISVQTSGEGGRTLFFADFYLWLHASTLLFLIFGANRLVNRYGLVLALLTTPFALFVGTSFLIFHSALLVMYILRIVYSALEDSVYTQSVDLMILEAAKTHPPAIQRLLHGLAWRAGRGVGAVFVVVLAILLGLSFQMIALFFMILLVVWALIALSLRSYFKKPLSLG
jgi:ATP/ADP translocase